mgnify:CR=1 FL=1
MEEQHYQLLDGKAVSAQMKKEMAEEVARSRLPEVRSLTWLLFWWAMTVVARLMWLVKSKTCQEIGFSLP